MIYQRWFEYGPVFGMRYFFSERGEGLAMHRHSSSEEHNVIVLRGSIRLTSRGSALLKDVPAPAIIETLPEWHELAALEPGTELLNLYKNGKPAEYAGLPDSERDVTFHSSALEHPL